jgi:hypothetical protein
MTAGDQLHEVKNSKIKASQKMGEPASSTIGVRFCSFTYCVSSFQVVKSIDLSRELDWGTPNAHGLHPMKELEKRKEGSYLIACQDENGRDRWCISSLDLQRC